MKSPCDPLAQIQHQVEAASGTQLALIAAISSLLRNGETTVDGLEQQISITRSMIISSRGSSYKVDAFDSAAQCLLAMAAQRH